MKSRPSFASSTMIAALSSVFLLLCALFAPLVLCGGEKGGRSSRVFLWLRCGFCFGPEEDCAGAGVGADGGTFAPEAPLLTSSKLSSTISAASAESLDLPLCRKRETIKTVLIDPPEYIRVFSHGYLECRV